MYTYIHMYKCLEVLSRGFSSAHSSTCMNKYTYNIHICIYTYILMYKYVHVFENFARASHQRI